MPTDASKSPFGPDDPISMSEDEAIKLFAESHTRNIWKLLERGEARFEPGFDGHGRLMEVSIVPCKPSECPTRGDASKQTDWTSLHLKPPYGAPRSQERR